MAPDLTGSECCLLSVPTGEVAEPPKEATRLGALETVDALPEASENMLLMLALVAALRPEEVEDADGDRRLRGWGLSAESWGNWSSSGVNGWRR